MTEAEFGKLLRDLTTASRAGRTARLGPRDDWLNAALHLGPAHQVKRRRYLRRQMWILSTAILLAAVLPLVLLLPLPTRGVAATLAHLLIQLAPYAGLCYVLFSAPPSLAPLLARLEDTQLVPLWLEALADCAPSQSPSLHERLTRHLPRYTEPLSLHAQKALLNEVRRLSQKRRNDDESAFLIAALVSLDRVDTVDARCHDALARLAEQSQEHLKAAAEDALLRVRR